MSRDGPLLMTKLEKRHLNLRVAFTCIQNNSIFFLFFFVFGDRDGDSIVGIKREKAFDFI